MKRHLFLWTVLLLSPLLQVLPVAHAQQVASVETTSNDPAIEARLNVLAEELRCLVCQNQTLADSDADLAIDLRNEIRSRMENGASDKQVVNYLVQRYGDFVMYRPPVKPATIALWFGPFILIILGGGLLIFYLRRLPARANNAPLSRAEHQRLDTVLDQAKKDAEV